MCLGCRTSRILFYLWHITLLSTKYFWMDSIDLSCAPCPSLWPGRMEFHTQPVLGSFPLLESGRKWQEQKSKLYELRWVKKYWGAVNTIVRGLANWQANHYSPLYLSGPFISLPVLIREGYYVCGRPKNVHDDYVVLLVGMKRTTLPDKRVHAK